MQRAIRIASLFTPERSKRTCALDINVWKFHQVFHGPRIELAGGITGWQAHASRQLGLPYFTNYGVSTWRPFFCSR